MHWAGQRAPSLPAPLGGPLRLGSTSLTSVASVSLARPNCTCSSLRQIQVCAAEVNFYFLAGRTSIHMLFVAVAAIPESATAKGVGESLHIPGWKSEEGEYALNRPLPARGHDSPQPQTCLLSTHNEPDMAGHRPPAILTSHCLGHNLAPLTGRQRSFLLAPWVTLRALHTTQYRGKPEAAAVAGRSGH